VEESKLGEERKLVEERKIVKQRPLIEKSAPVAAEVLTEEIYERPEELIPKKTKKKSKKKQKSIPIAYNLDQPCENSDDNRKKIKEQVTVIGGNQI